MIKLTREDAGIILRALHTNKGRTEASVVLLHAIDCELVSPEPCLPEYPPDVAEYLENIVRDTEGVTE